MEERRNFVRLKKRLKIEYKIIIETFASTAVPPNTSYTETISGNGLMLLSGKQIEQGKKLELSIEIPDGGPKPVETAGEVIGNKEIGPGEFEIIVRFFDIEENQRDRLVKFILKEGVKRKG